MDAAPFVDFLHLLKNHALQPCMEGDGSSLTYAELLNDIVAWRSHLEKVGVAPGSVVAVRADYSFAAVAALLAILERGAIAALIPRNGDATSYLTDSCASALLDFSPDGAYRWHFVPNAAGHPLLERLRVNGKGGIVVFTSGSTGRPKAALHSLERFMHKFRKPRRRFRTLAFLLFDHIAGLDTLFYTLASGGTLILTQRRDPRSILSTIESCKVEVLPASPSFLRLMCVAGANDTYDLSSLKVITYGSELMDASTLARVNALFPTAQISQKYGTTETGSPSSVSRGNNSLWLRIKSDSVETKVVKDILWIRSEGTVLGYLNAPSPVDDEGWYCTGDLVDVDGEWLRFRGREVDTINVGGEKVAPAEVEHAILELDFVRSAVVSGEPHALLGQVVAARVALTSVASDAREATRRIRLHCRTRLASHKVPVRIEIVADDLVSDRQKTQRKFPS